MLLDSELLYQHSSSLIEQQKKQLPAVMHAVAFFQTQRTPEPTYVRLTAFLKEVRMAVAKLKKDWPLVHFGLMNWYLLQDICSEKMVRKVQKRILKVRTSKAPIVEFDPNNPEHTANLRQFTIETLYAVEDIDLMLNQAIYLYFFQGKGYDVVHGTPKNGNSGIYVKPFRLKYMLNEKSELMYTAQARDLEILFELMASGLGVAVKVFLQKEAEKLGIDPVKHSSQFTLIDRVLDAIQERGMAKDHHPLIKKLRKGYRKVEAMQESEIKEVIEQTEDIENDLFVSPEDLRKAVEIEGEIEKQKSTV